MDNVITSLRALTESVVIRLQMISYEELDSFIEERQHLIDELNQLKLTSPFNPAQQKELQDIVQADSVILARMAALKAEAADWLQHRGQVRTQRNAYEASYTPDSILLDRRK
ncbi:hypothetical protein EJP77_06300 [Paenibacillus zeisoli]|uniref:Flagellar protein FliT n=1 Tax=Paenibacillus zeisoli TaxID=2496267 RepID=A0A3S1BTX0_9BACL|nr:hypothetical protein [Paenibacillus zeisoli]RUT33262.1 hypothetical protein EJP77_06300 [Paenibacillus zeisoli]